VLIPHVRSSHLTILSAHVREFFTVDTEQRILDTVNALVCNVIAEPTGFRQIAALDRGRVQAR
jgi:hypothetical protein